jgi:hypothetical protein
MKIMIKALALIAIVSLSVFSCKKEVKEPQSEIPDEIVTKVYNLGFSTENIQKVDNGYLVEGDIVLTSEYLDQQPSSPRLIIAEEEQYHTFNTVLVSGSSRLITVSVSASLPNSIHTAVNNAIARYNAEPITLDFSYVGTSGGNIHFSPAPSGAGYIASAGFPTSSGNPYNSVVFNTAYANYNSDFLTTVAAHEMGHCIGFRHTDYMRRRYSCGTGGNEGQVNNGVGAVHIPGTPTGPDANSWMLACLSATTNRPFNANDKIALDYLY